MPLQRMLPMVILYQMQMVTASQKLTLAEQVHRMIAMIIMQISTLQPKKFATMVLMITAMGK